MPADEVFEDPLFASLYDHFNGWDVCDDFYLALARTLKSGARVLDLGCGTGLLASRIAEEGFAVTGVDPAEGMLRVARARPGGERVSWIKSVGQAMRLPQRFGLIYMTGHAFQALTDEDALALLRTARDHLADGGLLAFETRNPARKAWLSWTPDKRRSAHTADHGEVEEFFDTKAEPDTGIVTLAAHYRFADSGKTIIGRSRIRFVGFDRLKRLLTAANLAPVTVYGDWDRSPLTETSREFIVIARRS